MAGCATRTSFAGHPSIAAKADDELTSNLDHLMGSGHIARGVMLKGAGPLDLFQESLWLASLMLLAMAVAVRRFRHTLD